MATSSSALASQVLCYAAPCWCSHMHTSLLLHRLNTGEKLSSFKTPFTDHETMVASLGTETAEALCQLCQDELKPNVFFRSTALDNDFVYTLYV